MAIYGYVSRLQIDLDVYVFGTPPAKYSASIEGINATANTDYVGALHLRIHYRTPQEQPIPAGTTIKVTIQPLNIVIELIIIKN